MMKPSDIIVQRHIACPVCPSSDGYCVYGDGHGHCFSCKYFKPSKEPELIDMTSFTYEYLPWRGVDKDVFRFYDVKTQIDTEGKPVSLGYRYPDGAVKVRTLDKKEFRWTKDGKSGADTSKTGLFGADKFDAGQHQSVTITEGELDALSLYQVLRSPVVSVQSAATAHRDCVAARDFLQGFERIVIAFDADVAGREALRSVAKLFDYNKVYVLKYNKHKDANEYIKASELGELKQLWNNARKYSPETILSYFDEFEEILKTKTNVGIDYPFPTLTDMTYGIRTGETVVLTAMEKVGKTSIMREILYKLLTETDHNVAAIFLEEPKLRLLQAIAGRELRRPVHLPDCGGTADELLAALQKVVVRDERLHVYSHFGSNDPEVLLDTIRYLVTARGCRYILFDHITMAVSGLSNERDERRALDYLSTRLEMMVKELDFSLIMVSHVNDYGQTRGSHYITKVADIVINAKRDTLAPSEEERNTIHLEIPFNRFCAKSGPAGKLRLNTDTYILEEVPDDLAANDNNPAHLSRVA